MRKLSIRFFNLAGNPSWIKPAVSFIIEFAINNCIIYRLFGKTAEANKLFSIISLLVKKGDTVTVSVDGENEEQNFNELKKLFTENF